MDIKTIQFIDDQWVVEQQHGQKEHYFQAIILIGNFLFSLIQLTHGQRKKFIILFHDQLTPAQLRLLHLLSKIKHNGI